MRDAKPTPIEVTWPDIDMTDREVEAAIKRFARAARRYKNARTLGKTAVRIIEGLAIRGATGLG